MSNEEGSETAPTYKLEIKGEGLELDREVSEQEVAQIMNVLLGSGFGAAAKPALADARGSGHGGVSSQTGGGPEEPTKSIAEFMSEVGASTNPERLAAIALYHRDVLGKGTVARDEFPTWFEKAGRSAPANPPRDISKAVKQKLIAESTTEEDHFYPTREAEQKLLEDNG